MIDLSLLEDFVTGAGESLDEMESALLELDLSANNAELLDTIFRAMHTIKGAAQFVGLEKVASLSHVVEDLLDLLREGKKQVTPEIVDVLIQTKDRISNLVVDLEKTQTEITEVDDLIQQINVFLGVETSEDTNQIETNQEEEPDDLEDDSEILAAFLSNDEDDETNAFSDFLESEPENNSPLLISNTDTNAIQVDTTTDDDDFNLFLSNDDDDDDADDLSIFLSEAVNPNDLDKLSVSKSEITPDSFEPEIKAETAEIKVFEISNEEHDKELFEIYIQQLQEKFHLIHEYNAHLKTSKNQEYLLIQIVEIIASLKFSANYMAYNQLTTLYERWLTQILNAQNKLSRSEKTSLVFMDLYLQELQQVFPQLSTTHQTENSAIEVSPPTTELNTPELPVEIPATENVIEPEVLSFPDEVVVTEIPPIQANTNINDEDLFNKLDAALNISSIEESITSEPINEVFSSLLSATEEQRSKNQPSSLKPEIKTLAEINQAHTEDSKTSIIPDSTTSKTIPAKKPVTKLKESSKAAVIKPTPAQKQPKTLNTNIDNKDNSAKISPPVEIKKKPEIAKKVFKKSIRVDADKIDSLMNQVGELIVDRAYLFQLANEINQLQNNLKESTGLGQKDLKPVRTFAYRFNEAIISLGRTSNELQEGVMKVRMLPIGQLFNRYPRLVHDVSQTSKKKVQLEIRGEDTELDKMIIEEISDPLIHIIRNAVDHGIETPAERLQQGKPETGHLILEAYHESNHILIEIIDDGKGIDTQRIKEKAEKIKLFSREELDRMSEGELTRFIMMPGFSTAKQISNTSGRGVGMDVVKKNIEKLNGSIEIESKPGLGTKMRLKIPLTLAIIHALLVRVGQDYFTIPLTNVEETLSVSEADISIMEETEVMYLRGKTLPIFRLSELFNLKSELFLRKDFFIVVVNTNSQRIGIMVDALIGQEEVVIKPLADYLHEGNCFSGATIIGDGRISLILDIYELINMTTKKQIKKHHAHEQKSFSLLDNNF